MTRAADLHQEGALLTALSGPCVDRGTALLVVNHYNQTGGGSSLKRITQAGMGEWADSWILVEHREKPDVAAGSFRLALDVGSRQWGGASWHLDVELGCLNPGTATHEGELSWHIAPADGIGMATSRSRNVDAAIRAVLADHPWELTKSELKTQVGGSRERFAAALDRMAERGEIESCQRSRDEAGTPKRRTLWGLVPTRAVESRPCSDEMGT